MAQVIITDVSNSVTVEQSTQAVTVSGSSNFPITVNYNATVFEEKSSLPEGGVPGQVLKIDPEGELFWAEDNDTITTMSEQQPQVAVEGQQWFNPTTQILQVYTAAGWVQVTADDLQF